MTVDLLELQSLTETERPITYGVVKPGVEDPEKGVLFVRGGDIADGSIDISVLRTITQEVSAPYARTILRGGEVVISLVGNPGAVAVVPDSLVGANLARQVGLIALKPEYHAPYVKYYLMSPQGKAELFQRTQGAVQQVINLADLKKIKVRVLPKPEQERIAGVLSAYDDLIENNRRRIALLEQSARLLYREWFVHLRFPGHEHVKVVDGVPEGWERKTMADVAETVGGGTPSTAVSAYWDDGDVTWFSPTDLTNNDCLALLSSGKKITEAGLKNSSAKMLPPETILMSSRASIGYFGLHDKPACTNQGFISLIPRDEQYRYYLLYNLMFRKGEIESKAGGTTYKEINKSTFRGMTIIWPDKTLASGFSDFAKDVMQQVRTLKRQNEKLAQARDLLLPRLMSGDLVV